MDLVEQCFGCNECSEVVVLVRNSEHVMAFGIRACIACAFAIENTVHQLIEGLVNMKALHSIALILVIVGGLNWLLVGAFDFDLVAALFGEMSPLSRVVYVLVGIAAVYTLFVAPRLIKREPLSTARA